MDPLKAGTLNLKPPTKVANSQPVQMTRAEYQAKYGTLPAQEPVKMTRAEYQAKFGSLPETPQQPKTLGQNVLGAAKGASNFINQNIARPFVDLAAMPVQKLAKSLGQPDPYADKALAGIDVAPVDKPLRKVGSAIEAGSYAFPFGTVTKGATALAKPVLGKIAPKVGNVAAGLAGGYGVDVGMNLSQGKEGSEAFKPGLGTVIGGAIPGVTEVGGAIKRGASNQAPRIINSLIKPLLKDFSYGKNPGRTVAELGITGNDLDELATNITTYKNQIGRQTRELSQSLPNGSIVFLGEALNPINEAIQKATASNNATVVRRLQEVKAALTRNLGLGKNGEIGSLGTKSWYKTGNSTYLDGLALKQQVGNLTKFTGNPSDDKEVNMALKRVYGSIKESLDKSATKANPEVAAKLRKANEQYADLQSAETATVYRDKIQQRSNLVGLTPTLAGIGSGIAALTVTGGAALPSLIAAGGGLLVDKALSSPAFKTRLAKWLAKLAPADRDLVEASFPKLQTIGDDLIGRSRDIIKETGGNRGFSKIPPVLRSTPGKNPILLPLKSSKPSTVTNTSTSKGLIERGGVSAQKTDTSGGFDGTYKKVATPKEVHFQYEDKYLGSRVKEALASRPAEYVAPKGTLIFRGAKTGTDGNWFSPDISEAESYAKSYGGQITTIDASGLKFVNLDKYLPQGSSFKRSSNQIEALLKKVHDDGYNGIVFNENLILPTEGQLAKWGKPSTAMSGGDLVAEAKKYKSAEDFVRKQPVIYHGTPETFTTFNTSKSEGNSTWFTDDKKDILDNTAGAVQGVGQKLNIMERYMKPNLKLATPRQADEMYTDQLIAEGYRGVKYPKGEYGDYEWTKLFNPNEDTVTKSQLLDIWKKANEK